MKLPCLDEMGDVGAALALLLKVQSEYARGEAGVGRAMRDVALAALEREIHRYMEGREYAWPNGVSGVRPLDTGSVSGEAAQPFAAGVAGGCIGRMAGSRSD